MPVTKRIRCVDSATGSGNWNPETAPNGTVVKPDSFVRNSELEYTQSLPYSGGQYLSISGAYVFDNSGISFLDAAQITSMNLSFGQGAVEDPGNYSLYLKYLGIRMGSSQTTGARAIFDTSVVFSKIMAQPGTPRYTVEVPSVSILRNLLQYGLTIGSGDSQGFGKHWTGIYSARTENVPYIEVSYFDLTAPTVTVQSPKNTTINALQDNLFKWDYSQQSDEVQSHYEIQVLRNGIWTALSGVVPSGTNQHTVLARTLNAKDTQWRIRVYSISGAVISAWAYADITVIDDSVAPEVEIVSPKDCTVNGLEANRFEWSYKQASGAPQTHFDIQIYKYGVWTTIANKLASSTPGYKVPAGTLTYGVTQWRVRAYSSANSAASEWSTTTISVIDDSIPPVAVAEFPRNIVINGSEENTFRWIYTQAAGAIQSHFDLEIYDRGVWRTLATKVQSSSQTYNVPAGSFSNGEAFWRVRAYVKNGAVYSAWNQSAFVVHGIPPKPTIIKITDTPRIHVEWVSAEQQGYQIRIGDFDSGTVYGTDPAFTLPYFHPDGEVAVQVRVIGKLSLWSDWATGVAKVKNKAPGSIQLRAASLNDYSVRLRWEATSECEQYYVLRNGIPIAKTQGKEYRDFLSNGCNSYVVRGVKGEYYVDSASASDTVKVPEAVISKVDAINWLPLEKKRGGKPEHSREHNPEVVYRFYEGRKKPTPYKNGHQAVSHSLAFTHKKRDDYLMLDSLVGEVVVYKDCMGEVFIGVLDRLSTSNVRVYDEQFRIMETDFREEVAYD